jgi:hypothetical protein
VVQIPGEFIVPESGSKKEIYAIVQEKLSIGAPKKLRVAGDMVYTYLDKFAQPLENIDAAYNFIMKNMMPAKWKNDKDVERLTRQVLDAVKKLQDEKGITYRDPHGGNLKYRGRQPAFFDLGRSTPMPAAKLGSPKMLGRGTGING